MSKVIGLERNLTLSGILAGNSITDIDNALAANQLDHHDLLNKVHAEVFYANGLIGVIHIAKVMEVEETPKGYRFKETEVVSYKDYAPPANKVRNPGTGEVFIRLGTETDYVFETLRRLAAKTANEVLDEKFNAASLEENCELFIQSLVEAIEDLSE
jgi:hypothetical protein